MDIRSLARIIATRFGRAWAWREETEREFHHSAPGAVEACTAAELRARQLLIRMLTAAQRKELQRHGYFAVQVAGRGTFWILPSTFFNVLHAQTGICYCATPRGEVPLSDLMLAQKLWLENDPEAFFAVANCRAELIPGRVAEQLGPRRVLQARARPSPATPRWSELSMIPHENRFP